MPEGSLLISVLREGTGFVPNAETVLQAGDEILAVLDPTVEEDLTAYFGPDGSRARASGYGAGDGRTRGRLPDRRRRAGRRVLRVGAAPRRAPRGRSCSPAASREPPYERPPLSKEYLRGEAERADAYVNPADWYEENDVELLHPHERDGARPAGADREAAGRGGGRLRARRCWPPGANVNILRVEGAELEGIHYLRAFGNSDAIREQAAAAERVVLIGGSYIGARWRRR